MKSVDKTSPLPRLWLVERVPVEKFQINPKLELPQSNVKALAEIFMGSTDHEVKLLVFDLLRQICGRELRLACNCTSRGILRPEISCRTRRGGRSFYLAKMPSSEKRPDHVPGCPFSRSVKFRIDKVKRTKASAFEFAGNFALPVGRQPGSERSEVGSRHGRGSSELPKMIRMFASLLGEAGFAHLVSSDDRSQKLDLYEQFDRLRRAARSFQVAKGIPLQRVFSQSLYDKDLKALKRRIGLRYENVSADKPRTGFVALYATDIGLRKLRGPSGELSIESDILLLPGTRLEDYTGTPSLALICFAAPGDGYELKPISACAFPVFGGNCFTPVLGSLGRAVLSCLLDARHRLGSSHPHLSIEIEGPLERIVRGVLDLPDFIINSANAQTGEVRSVYCVLDHERFAGQPEARAAMTAQWRSVAGRAVFEIDAVQTDDPDTLREAISTCLI